MWLMLDDDIRVIKWYFLYPILSASHGKSCILTSKNIFVEKIKYFLHRSKNLNEYFWMVKKKTKNYFPKSFILRSKLHGFPECL